MKKINYVSFKDVNTLDWLKILNEPVLRRHLVEHDIFNETTINNWAKELGHHEVLCHLLDSRREYKALKKFTDRIKQSQLLNRYLVSYYVSVNQWHKLQSENGDCD